MTPEIMKQRVAIAEDVLLRLKASKLKAGKGSYLLDEDWPDLDQTSDARPVIDVIEAACQVCARGAMLLSQVRLFNCLTVGEVRSSSIGIMNRKHLQPIFGDDQINLIESAFEMDDFTWGDNNDADGAIGFGERYDEPEERLAAIMNNIVANGGDFRPWEAL